MPNEVLTLLNSHEATKILATQAPDGGVHAVQLGSIMAPDARTIAFGAILMKHSGENLEKMKGDGALASVLVVKGKESYQVRGKVKDAHTSGPLFDKMNEELAKLKMSARCVWTIEPVEVWDQSASPKAGTKIA